MFEVCGGLEPTCTDQSCAVLGPPLAPVAGTLFAIDSTEVTQAEYAGFLASNPTTQDLLGVPMYCITNSTYAPFDDANWAASEPSRPVVGVDWCDALAFCDWTGKSLCGATSGGNNPVDSSDDPTKSRWFRACVGPDNLAFPYGSSYNPDACNGASNNLSSTIPVASLATCEGGTPGVFDMSGNVREWENSCEPLSAPGSRCLVRGGGFSDVESALQCTSAVSVPRNTHADDIGFRCCSRP
ncbi:MAG: SUMF1/EgtB/PvdO family nonheme iron enzyme [Polyangiaceae bacterium]